MVSLLKTYNAHKARCLDVRLDRLRLADSSSGLTKQSQLCRILKYPQQSFTNTFPPISQSRDECVVCLAGVAAGRYHPNQTHRNKVRKTRTPNSKLCKPVCC